MNSFFGIGAFEFVFILIFALIFLGPERLPQVLREIVGAIRKIRGLTAELTQQFNEELGDLAELDPRRQMQGLFDEPKKDSKKKTSSTKSSTTKSTSGTKSSSSTKSTSTTKAIPTSKDPSTAAKASAAGSAAAVKSETGTGTDTDTDTDTDTTADVQAPPEPDRRNGPEAEVPESGVAAESSKRKPVRRLKPDPKTPGKVIVETEEETEDPSDSSDVESADAERTIAPPQPDTSQERPEQELQAEEETDASAAEEKRA